MTAGARKEPGVIGFADSREITGVTGSSPVDAIAAALLVAGHAVSLDDQRELTRMLGLDGTAP